MKRKYIILSVAILLVALNGCSTQKVSNNNGQDNNNKTITESDAESNTDKTENSTDSKTDVKQKDRDTQKDTTRANSGKTESSTNTNQTSSNTNETSSNTTNYEIADETYTKLNIKIIYPQIKNFNDSKKSDLINKNLKDQALAVTNYYDLSNSNATLEVSYDIQLKDRDNLSIVYKGYFNSGSSAYPMSVFYTTNIDLNEGTSRRLKDYANVNEIFNKFKNSNELSNIAKDQALAKAQIEYISNMDDSTLKAMLENADFYESNGNIQFPEAFSYRKNDNIIIGIPVPHAIGDYAEFGVRISP